MEVNEHGFLEELLALRRDNTNNTLESFPIEREGINQFITNGWSFDSFEENPDFIIPANTSSSFEGFITASNEVPCFDFSAINKMYYPFGDGLLEEPMQEMEHNGGAPTPPFLAQVQECNQVRWGDDKETDFIVVDDDDHLQTSLKESQSSATTSCKVELVQGSEIPVVFDMGLCLERKNRVKKVTGQPSKNLMAERRRRKRLNDRLSMLRSVVPKISKMDRTSIVGDTIDYAKELLERIKNLQEEIKVDSNELNLMDINKEQNPNAFMMRNTPKFNVERRNTDTRIEICCGGKPGLLISTVNALETLGLDIQQCVISCFSEFSMQASCSEELEQREGISPDNIKQELSRSAGYGGRCL